MLIEDIRSARRSEPFVPFQIQLKDGATYSVAQPLHIAIEPNGRSVSVALPGGGFELVETESIECVRFLETSSI